jgi:hypothetical protein
MSGSREQTFYAIGKKPGNAQVLRGDRSLKKNDSYQGIGLPTPARGPRGQTALAAWVFSHSG